MVVETNHKGFKIFYDDIDMVWRDYETGRVIALEEDDKMEFEPQIIDEENAYIEINGVQCYMDTATVHDVSKKLNGLNKKYTEGLVIINGLNTELFDLNKEVKTIKQQNKKAIFFIEDAITEIVKGKKEYAINQLQKALELLQ